MGSSKMNFFQNILPPRPSQRNNNHHYVCCGNVHAKFALLIIILIRTFFTIYLSAEIVTDQVYYSWGTEAFYDAIEILALICLIIGYLREESKWTWPYMAIEFTCLCLGLLAYAICVAAMIVPSKFAGIWFEKELGHLTEPTNIRSHAFWTGLEAALYSTVSAFELSILLASNRYFDDERLRKRGLRDRPIILNHDNAEADSRGVVVDMEPVMEENKHGDNRGFPNPNFSLVDSDDETDAWHSTNKKANVLA